MRRTKHAAPSSTVATSTVGLPYPHPLRAGARGPAVVMPGAKARAPGRGFIAEQNPKALRGLAVLQSQGLHAIAEQPQPLVGVLTNPPNFLYSWKWVEARPAQP